MRKLIGDKAFYKTVLGIAVPIMVQNGISNFVNMLDNIMIGRIGTEQMSGVSIVNQLLFILQLCLFGALSGAGIIGAQYYGQKNYKGVKDVFKIKLLTSFVILIVSCLVFIIGSNSLIGLYLHESNDGLDLAATLLHGKQYLYIMLIGILPMCIEMSYSSTLRECGETKVSMRGSIIAVILNLILNYILIYGKFGAPQLGVAGAAIATVVSRFVQMGYVIIWTHKNLDKVPYMEGVYQKDKLYSGLIGKIILLGLPLTLNETMWSAGMAAVNTCYSVRGLNVIAAINIQSVIYNIFNIMYIALGDSVAILVGQELGANNIEKAKDTARKLIAFSVATCAVFSTLMFISAPYFPLIYKTSDDIRNLATKIIIITACYMPIHAFLHAVYFAIRSGGKTFITFLFDSVYLWIVAFPVAYVLAHYTGLDFVTMFIVIESVDLIKVTVGFCIFRSGIWAKNITT